MCEQIVTVGRMSSVGVDIVLLKNYYLMQKLAYYFVKL